ncbi:MAG: 4Fe-4S dicluster domain-containing protein [candidate division KSB1 bacterium]|nr:4Fe-4S dicluster domain-containing protein [candidate division KSB1 bacterium]
MGHLTGKSVYKHLQHRLDRMPVGAPEHKALYEILQIMYTEEEAWVASRMPLRFASLRTIAERTDRAEQELEPLLNRMAEKGLVMDFQNREGKTYYILCPTVIGFFEFSLMRRRQDFDQKTLSHWYHEYMFGDTEYAFLKEAMQGQTQLVRTLIHEEAIPQESYVEVLDYEKASQIIKEASNRAVGLCHCRHVKEHIGQPCPHPLENCLSLNSGADFIIRRGLGRQVSLGEALDILAQSKEMNMVQTGDNVQRRVAFICNCCGCGCAILEAFKRVKLSENSMHTSNFIASVDEEECLGCGKCVQVCPVEVLSLVPAQPTLKAKKRKKKAVVDESRCLGCGVCTSACVNNALKMRQRKRRVFTPETTFERVILMALERGKLHHFIFDNVHSIGISALNQLLGLILNNPLVHKLMLREGIKSRCVAYLVDKASAHRSSTRI